MMNKTNIFILEPTESEARKLRKSVDHYESFPDKFGNYPLDIKRYYQSFTSKWKWYLRSSDLLSQKILWRFPSSSFTIERLDIFFSRKTNFDTKNWTISETTYMSIVMRLGFQKSVFEKKFVTKWCFKN